MTQTSISVVAVMLLPPLSDAIKCYQKVVSNGSQTEQWIVCPVDCCGGVCCPAKDGYDTTATETLAKIFACLFLVGTIGFILSWTNIRKVTRLVQRRPFYQETNSMTSVDNIPMSMPAYDIPTVPNFQGRQPLDTKTVPAACTDQSNDSTNLIPVYDKSDVLSANPPDYSTIMLERENKDS